MTKRRAVVLAVVLLLCTAGSLLAGPPYEYERIYFTDETREVMCGWRGIYCDHSSWWGCVTPYYADEYFGPCDPMVEPWP